MDSYRGNASDPLSLNLYTYAYNNPIYYIDPSGHNPAMVLEWAEYYGPQVWNEIQYAYYMYGPQALQGLQEAGNWLVNNGAQAWESIKNIPGDVADTISYAVDKTKEGIDKAADWVRKQFGGGGSSGGQDPNKFKEGADALFNKGRDLINKFNLDDAYVKPKHLANTAGNARKFLGANKAEAEQILRQAMKNGKIVDVLDNGISGMGNQSYKIIIDAGKEIGTRGETLIRVVLSNDGGMLSAFPTK